MVQPVTATTIKRVPPAILTENDRLAANFQLDRLATLNALVRAVTQTPRPTMKPVPVRVRNLD